MIEAARASVSLSPLPLLDGAGVGLDLCQLGRPSAVPARSPGRSSTALCQLAGVYAAPRSDGSAARHSPRQGDQVGVGAAGTSSRSKASVRSPRTSRGGHDLMRVVPCERSADRSGSR